MPYDAIGALNPDFFVQFKYPVYAGEQVLFRDELCTSPVTDAGNHTIGGVKNPFTGAIVLTQPSASSRPLWLGPGVGAFFDGIDDCLLGVNNGFLSTEFSEFVSYSDLVRADPVSNTHQGLVSGGSTDRVSLLWAVTALERLYAQTHDETGERLGAILGAQDMEKGVAGIQVFNDFSGELVGEDGQHKKMTSSLYFNKLGRLVVGALDDDGRNPCLGNIHWVFAADRITTPAEELILRANP